MITNKYIDGILRRLIQRFGGTFSSNNTPDLSQTATSYVCNFSKRGTFGTHFVAFIKTSKGIYYIDSLATENDFIPTDIKKWMEKQDGKKFIKYYKKRVQANNSTFCGFYCILALLEETYGLKRVQFRTATGKREENDTRCINRIIKIISKIKRVR